MKNCVCVWRSAGGMTSSVKETPGPSSLCLSLNQKSAPPATSGVSPAAMRNTGSDASAILFWREGKHVQDHNISRSSYDLVDILGVVSRKMCLKNVTNALLLKCHVVIVMQESCEVCG